MPNILQILISEMLKCINGLSNNLDSWMVMQLIITNLVNEAESFCI